MGRTAGGWKLRLETRTGIWNVRFRHNGIRYSRSTGERDRLVATRRAQEIYARLVLAGPAPESRLKAGDEGCRTEDAVANWIISIRNKLDERTQHSYGLYARAQWIPRWDRLSEIGERAIERYTEERLGQVLRQSVLKELSALRGFLAWCRREGLLTTEPKIEQPPPRAIGTPDTSRRRKREAIPLERAEVEMILAALPEWSGGGPTGEPFRVRDRYVFAFETGLRPETVSLLRAPQHYRKGQAELIISRDIDKARDGRPLAISKRAREVLERICPESGLIFGRHRGLEYLRASCQRLVRQGRLDQYRADRITDYDFRHARLTQLAGLPGCDLRTLMRIAGHRHASTTDRYIRAARGDVGRLLEMADEKAPPKSRNRKGS